MNSGFSFGIHVGPFEVAKYYCPHCRHRFNLPDRNCACRWCHRYGWEGEQEYLKEIAARAKEVKKHRHSLIKALSGK